MINCIYGHRGTGKTEYIYDKIQGNIRKNVKSFIIVPEQSSMNEEKRMIEKLGISAQLKVEVLTFSRMCNLIFSQIGPLRSEYIDKAGKLFVVKKTLREVEKDLTYYKKNVRQKGFSQMVSKLISELKRYGVGCDELFSASQKTSDTTLGNKLRDIALISEMYDKLISGKYSDSEENLNKAIPGIVKSGIFKGEIFLLGFKSFTPVDLLALGELMECGNMTVLLTADSLKDKDGIFASAVSTWDKLREIAKAKNIAIGEVKCFSLPAENEERKDLHHLKYNYFKYPDNIYNEETPNISLISARDTYDEVRMCSEIILRLCRKENRTFNDFLILARNPESYYAAVKAVFGEKGISCFINEKKSLSQNIFIKKILAVLEILAFGFSYERIMPVVRFCGDKFTKNEGDIFENYVLASNISHKYWENREDWMYDPDPDRINIETVNKVKRFTVNSVLDLKEIIKDGKKRGERNTVKKLCRALVKWVEKEELGVLMGKRCEMFGKEGKTALALEYSRAWTVFSSVITQMESGMGDDTVTYAEFYEMLREVLSESEISIAPPLSNQVTFAGIDTFRSIKPKVVFVLGLSDGVFPKGYIEDGMLTDDERAWLSELDIELAPTAEFKRNEEQNLIYNVLSAPNEKLFLSAPLGDSEGKAKQPSEIIVRVKKLFPGIAEEKEEAAVSECSEVIFKNLLSALVEAEGDFAKLSPQNQKLFDFFSKGEKEDELSDFVNSLRDYKEGESLTEKQAMELYGKKLMLSVSKLEKYNACAFAYFMNYGLYAKERMKAGFEANNVGTILHEVLEKYLQDLKKRKADYGSITYEECKKEVSVLAERSARENDELLYETSPYYRYITLRVKAIATATLWEIIGFYANSCFRPFGFEVEIGENGSMPGMKMKIDDCTAEVRGFIDRIDMAEINGERFINIVDYKSSVKSANERLEEAGVQIQPLVYAGIAKANLNATPSGMMYIHMNEPVLKFDTEPDEKTLEAQRRKKIEVKGVILSDEELISAMDSRDESGQSYIPGGKKSRISRESMSKRIENAENKVLETAKKIIKGNIEINPKNDKDFSACKYCAFYQVCGKDKTQI